MVLVNSNRPSAKRSADFEITSPITPWIVLHSVQLRLQIRAANNQFYSRILLLAQLLEQIQLKKQKQLKINLLESDILNTYIILPFQKNCFGDSEFPDEFRFGRPFSSNFTSPVMP